MLVVVVMSLFVGGTLVVLSGVLLLCRRCWEVHRRFNRCVRLLPLCLPEGPHSVPAESWYTMGVQGQWHSGPRVYDQVPAGGLL